MSTRRNHTIDGLREYYLLRAARARKEEQPKLAELYRNAALDIERIFTGKAKVAVQ